MNGIEAVAIGKLKHTEKWPCYKESFFIVLFDMKTYANVNKATIK